MARSKKQGWEMLSATISGEVVEAIRTIAQISRRDTGTVLDELLRKAGALEIQKGLLLERIAELTALEKRVEEEEMADAAPDLPTDDSHLPQEDPHPPFNEDPEYHRLFAVKVFEELDRTSRLCQLEEGLCMQGLSPSPKAIDEWRRTKRIPFEYHQAILRFLDEPNWNAEMERAFRRRSQMQEDRFPIFPVPLQRGISPLVTGTTDSPMF